jgi:hypothetical protein
LTTDRDELPRLHIVVDASKVVRCKWCGTVQSENWIASEYGYFFCSDICAKAFGSEKYWYCLTPLVCVIPFFTVLIFLASGQELGFIGFVGLLVCGVLLSISWCIYEDKQYAKDVPKNSRWIEGSVDVSLLKTVARHIECPNCDGNLDLSKVKEDMIYHCDYCGASGEIEVVKMKQ